MITYFFSLIFAATCNPPTVTYELPGVASGSYMRVHPSGKYLILSTCMTELISEENNVWSINGACLVDLTKTPPEQPKVIPTQLNDEAYAIEPNWDLIASPDHENGTKMHYYRFSDLISVPKEKQKPVYTSRFNEYYHSAATIAPGRARVMVWSDLRFQDYTIDHPNNTTRMQPVGAENYACNNLLPHNFDFKRFSTLRTSVETQWNSCEPTFEETEASFDKLKECYDRVQNSADYKAAVNLQSQLALVLENPILSKDGSEVGGLQNGKLTIFRLETNGQCEVVDQLPFRGSKMSFSFPVPGKKGRIAFLGDSGNDQDSKNVYVYDRDTKKTHLIASNSAWSTYPVFTRDGKLMYLSRRVDGTNAVSIVDLNHFDLSRCEEFKETTRTPPTQQ